MGLVRGYFDLTGTSMAFSRLCGSVARHLIFQSSSQWLTPLARSLLRQGNCIHPARVSWPISWWLGGRCAFGRAAPLRADSRFSRTTHTFRCRRHTLFARARTRFRRCRRHCVQGVVLSCQVKVSARFYASSFNLTFLCAAAEPQRHPQIVRKLSTSCV